LEVANSPLGCQRTRSPAGTSPSAQLGLHSNTINVWLFAEWDTLYGRSLVDTFKSLAAPSEQQQDALENIYSKLATIFSKSLSRLNATPDGGTGKAHLLITVVPYLRGLDGASTLYQDAYSFASDNKPPESGRQTLAPSSTWCQKSSQNGQVRKRNDY